MDRFGLKRRKHFFFFAVNRPDLLIAPVLTFGSWVLNGLCKRDLDLSSALVGIMSSSKLLHFSNDLTQVRDCYWNCTVAFTLPVYLET